ncbi:MAG: CDP-diacylglycerol--serine O-phosphatidyltransferase [Myxococcales bacterium]|nr:CDP-diacylglycerol--serine O-phosphatidyltransferase [Myxococcales bacterium]MCB9568862.1 CDP-diacylglycerol--serine O-phosphatidyltransferase [Myxococcales bacterium]MCB9704871.1 CDP-diacylglycerol--serine O-phosphatidyltransferase [Myxococcales bacterium]
MNFWKSYFLLPNLFTLANVFCGFYAITLCARLGEEGADSDVLYKAALAIVFGLFFDATDGRIARLTKTQSELGLQLDSLADVVTFGMAPAILIYRWGLEDLGRVGIAVAFVFLACGALRLARFNVLATREAKVDKYMLGLPIPVAATAIVGLVLASHAIGVPRTTNAALLAVMVAVLGYLMISRVHFRSFKELKPTGRTLATAGTVAVLAVVVATRISRPAILLLLVACYITLGFFEEMIFLRRRFSEYRAARLASANGADPEAASLAAEESVVLAELGMDE